VIVVVADIGGTHARFALAQDGALSEVRVYAAVELTSDVAAVARYLDDVKPDAAGAVIAVAGPVIDGVGRLTNLPLEFSAREIARRTRLARVLVINDFAAVSAAVPFLAAGDLRGLGAPRPRDATKAVLGPGTGLGMGALLALDTVWRVLPSEGGHGDLPAADPLEAALVQALRARLSGAPVTWETVLSGPGLVNLYRAMCDVRGCAATFDSARDVSAAGAAATDPVCRETLEVFCRVLGSAAAHLALTFCAEGGVYLAGGIVPQLADFLATSEFRRRFDDRGGMRDYVSDIATIAILEPMVGLTGAARAFAGEWHAGGLQLPRDSSRRAT
jgi:glucokinase